MGESGMEKNFHNSSVAEGVRTLPVAGAKAVVQVDSANSTRDDVRGMEERESSHPRAKGPSLATEPVWERSLRRIWKFSKVLDQLLRGEDKDPLLQHLHLTSVSD
ncbi:hypothetical protein MRB53_021721 [Persea americana]|uniref:Uncharacterized protein n=1 Tax=Persea americana TaxID=3435 RepID=A0ACC2L4R4_PERAE|nr:hypothetical protein MRB53_021721 [Persea americana]